MQSTIYIAQNIIERLKVFFNYKDNIQLCERLNIKYNTLNTWLQRNKIPHDLLVDLAQANNISLNWLFFGIGKISLSSSDDENNHGMGKFEVILDELTFLFASKEKLYEALEELLIKNILDRINEDKSHLIFHQILKIANLDKSVDARPFLFLYYIVKLIKIDDDSNKIINYQAYLLDKINSFKVISFQNKPFFTNKIKKEFYDFIEEKTDEKDCRLIVQNADVVIKLLEENMPPAIVRAHKNILQG